MSVQTTLRILEMPEELTPPDITFHFETKCTLTGRRSLKNFLNNLFWIEKQPFAGLTYIFCSDEYLLEINRTYLKHDFYTDIITFDMSDLTMKRSLRPTIGEIYISVDRVRENAKTHNTTFSNELHRVIFHGALHLCGYKDKTKSDSAKMRAAEGKYLARYRSTWNI